MSESNIVAAVAYNKGSLLIKGTRDIVVSIRYTNEKTVEVLGFGEVFKAYTQLKEYFNHQRKTFDFTMDIVGTTFQQAVYQALRNVEYHHTLSYKELAQRAGYPKAARAVGQAMANNPLLIVVPCHRVLASNQKLGGFSGGLDLKKELLAHEGISYKE
jgi:methylated-DNA-[protein]-cysteine S-methyltransferase